MGVSVKRIFVDRGYWYDGVEDISVHISDQHCGF